MHAVRALNRGGVRWVDALVPAVEYRSVYGVQLLPSPAKRFVFIRWLAMGEAMAKRQRVFKGGVEYEVIGPTKRKRRLVFVNTLNIEKKEFLLFRPVRKIAKQVES